MDYSEPKTRKELKGRDNRGADPYNQKRVRQLEAIMEKKIAGTATAKKGKG
jgi:hypothetical protein